MGHKNENLHSTIVMKQKKDKQKYKKNCGICGKIVKKELWVRTDDEFKNHPLCAKCYSDCDHPGDY